jgi:hypothetical protein
VTFTYSPGRIAQQGRDYLRFKLGDTRKNNPLLSDEELDGVLALSAEADGAPPDPSRALYMAAESLANKFRNQVTRSVGQLRLEYGQRTQYWTAEAARLRKLSTTAYAPRAIVTRTGEQAERDDPERRPDYFHEGLHDLPGSTAASSPDPLAP